MDTRTIGQILTNPDWLRSTLAEERPIQQFPAPTPQQEYTGYQQVTLPPHPSTFVPTPPPFAGPDYRLYQQPPPAVPMRAESPLVEVRGTIAYVARYRAEYFNDHDPMQMQALAQAVISGQTGTEPGELPPPWFPDVQFWLQTFEKVDPYADARQAELERLHAAKLAQEELARQREAELAEQLRRERALYGEPGTFVRAGTLTGLAVPAERENGWDPGPVPGSAGPDWIGSLFRDITGAIAGIHERLEAMERRADGTAGADPGVHSDADRPGDPDRTGRDQPDAAAARRNPERGVVVAAYADEAASDPGADAVGVAWDPVSEPGGDEPEPVRPRSDADRGQRKTALRKG